MEDAVLAPIQSAKSKDYEGGSGFNAAVKPSQRTTNETQDEKPGNQSHGMEDPALTPVQSEEPKKCKPARPLPPIISLCRPLQYVPLRRRVTITSGSLLSIALSAGSREVTV